MAAKRRAALGFKVRIGRAAVVAVAGADTVDAPEGVEIVEGVEVVEILGKTRIDVAFTFDEGAVYHVGQELPLEKAATFARESEARFVERARAELARFVAGLNAKIVAAGMAAPIGKTLPPLETILKAHPMVHAAEGELYRRVFTEAGASLGARPTRVPADVLAKRVAAAIGVTPAKVIARLAVMGKASGKPWAADQKEAALAAWLALATA